MPGPWICAIALAGCLQDPSPPSGRFPDQCNGDGVCDIRREDCLSCPGDCPCCAIVDSSGVVAGNAADAQLATGVVDGKTVGLDQFSELQLAFGREVYDQELLADFEIHGSVSTSEEEFPTFSCTGSVAGSRAFEIAVSDDGSNWPIVGVWTDKSKVFDLGCAQLKSIRWVRIRGQRGAEGELDAITAKAGSCLE